MYPNMFSVLVGHPGLGKGRAINPAVNLLRESGCANIMSDKLTIQYVLETLSKGFASAQVVSAPQQGGQGNVSIGNVTFGIDASCFISAPELQVFLTASDALPSLAELWEGKDGPSDYGTRGKGLVKITKPCPSLLGGCTPRQIVMSIPNAAIMSGFTRRVNFVYESERYQVLPWPAHRNGNDVVHDDLINDLRHISTLRGEFTFDTMARKMFEDYYRRTGCDEFADEATATYETTKPYHALKLAMILTIARMDRLIINFIDLQHAINMIEKCAEDLKRVFRAVGDSDLAVIMDKVLRYIEGRSRLTFVTRADIMGALWRDVGSSQNLDVIMATLEAGNVIRAENKSGITIYKMVKVKLPTTNTIQ